MIPFDQYDDFTLYEVFHEAGTELGGALTELEDIMLDRHDRKSFETLQKEHNRINSDRMHVAKTDRESQIRYIRKWTARRNAVRREIDAQSVNS